MRDAGRNDNETARRVALEVSRVESFSRAQIPSPFDDRNQFVLRVRMCEDAHAARYLNPIDPRPALAGIAEQLRPLPPILVVRRREPPHLFRCEPDDLFLGFVVPGHCRRYRRKNHRYGSAYKKSLFHVSLLSTENEQPLTFYAKIPSCIIQLELVPLGRGS